MVTIRVNVDLPADVATVWADIERLETHTEWMADAESIQFADEQRRGVGVVMNVRTRVGPLRTMDVIRVTSWVPPRSIGVSHEGLVSGCGEFRLEPTGVGCRFTWEERLGFPWYFGGELGALLAAPILRIVWRRNLARLSDRYRS